MTEESNIFYYNIAKRFKKDEDKEKEEIKKDTTFVIVTDLNYFKKAKRTIIDLRSRGNWSEDIVVVTIDFNLNSNFKDFYNIIEVQFPLIDKSELLSKIGDSGFSNSDKREITKLNQWEKLHVFDDYFMKWNRVVFLDAGLRVLDDVKYLLELDYKGKIIAPRDAKLYETQAFRHQLDFTKPELIDNLISELKINILDMDYMLNCLWIYDTNILRLCDKNQLIEAMNKYPFSRNNEMGIMNILLRFKYNLWERLPVKASNNKFTFDWCELHNPNTNWKDYCLIKYPVTISFEDC